MSEAIITLRWDDNNEIEKGYRIYRSDTPMDTQNMPPIYETLDKNITEYVDSNVVVDSTYFYRLARS